MDGKIEQRVCIKFCGKLCKSATETHEMLREAFRDHSLSRIAVFEWHSRFTAGRVSIEDDEYSGRPSTSKTTESAEEIENSSMKTVAGQSLSSQTPLGSVMEFARRSEQKILTYAALPQVCFPTLEKLSKAAARKRVS
jgi:hypothetical protein